MTREQQTRRERAYFDGIVEPLLKEKSGGKPELLEAAVAVYRKAVRK